MEACVNQDAGSDIVPFGKYRGQPVETILADQNYLEWMLGQPGIVAMVKSKYPAFFNIITIGAQTTDDTPEDNKFQAMFLDRDFQYAFIEAILGKSVYAIAQEVAEEATALKFTEVAEFHRILKERIKSIEKLIEYGRSPAADQWDRQQLPEREKALKPLVGFEQTIQNFIEAQILVIEPNVSLDFECGFDIKFSVLWWNKHLNWASSGRDLKLAEIFSVEITDHLFYSGNKKRRHNDYDPAFRRIEIKPQMGDDFPAVLRQIKRNGADTLVLGSFEATTCDLDQVRAIFGAIKIVTLAEIQAIKTRGMWPSAKTQP